MHHEQHTNHTEYLITQLPLQVINSKLQVLIIIIISIHIWLHTPYTLAIWLPATQPSKFRYHQILLSNLTFLFLSISPLSYPFPLLLLHYRPVSSDCTYFWCNWGGHADQLNTPPHIVKWGGGLLFVLFFIFTETLGWNSKFIRNFP